MAVVPGMTYQIIKGSDAEKGIYRFLFDNSLKFIQAGLKLN
jgi:hypothetical protein